MHLRGYLWLCEIWCTRTVAWIVPAGAWGVVIAMVTKTWNLYIVDLTQVCSCLIILHCSLRDSGLTDTGAIALARALEHNTSLEELKWVVDWVSCYQELWGLKNTYLHTIGCGRFLPCILPPTLLILSDSLSDYLVPGLHLGVGIRPSLPDTSQWPIKLLEMS